MTAVDLARISIKKYEGLKLKVYKDSVGIPTIGYGRNLQDNGISRSEADLLLSNDIEAVVKSLEPLEVYKNLDANRQAVLIDMCFNMGLTKLMTFKAFLKALSLGQYEVAAQCMLSSRWATQVGYRAKELASIMKGSV